MIDKRTKRTAAEQRMAVQVARATKRVAQLQARQLFHELREAAQEKEAARRSGTRLRLEIGSLVQAVVPDWGLAEVAGALIDGRARASHSPTVRVAYRRHGEGYLAQGRRSGSVQPSIAGPEPVDRHRASAETIEGADASDVAAAATLAAAMGSHDSGTDTRQPE